MHIKQKNIDAKIFLEFIFFNTIAIIKKLKLYQDLGVDEFIYYASMGLGHKEQKKSLKLFIEEVMPEFC